MSNKIQPKRRKLVSPIQPKKSGSRRVFFSGLALSMMLCCSGQKANAGPSGMTLEGVNISGGEFNTQTVPGVYGTNYIYPSNAELDYFSSKGMTCVRVPFSWE